MTHAFQSYEPYRTSLLSKEDLQELQCVRPARMIRDTVLGWAGILAGFALVWAVREWWAVAIAIPLIGTRYYSLLIVGHDGLHRHLFAAPKKSDLWNDLFCIGAIGAVTHLNRRNHMSHHGHLALANDPDRYKYVGANKTSRLKLLLVLTGLPYVARAVANVFLPGRAQATDAAGAAAPKPGYSARDVAIIVGWQVVLIGGLTWAIGWWAYPVLWLVPVYCFGFVADIVRVFCEHSAMCSDEEADRTLRLVSFTSNAFERQFFAPNNMNCHIAHHLWPGIPYYHLPEAERRVSLALGDRPTTLQWRPSYVRHILDYWRWLGEAPGAPHGRAGPVSATVPAASLPREFDDPAIPRIESESVGACVLCRGARFSDFASGFDYELRTCSNRWTFRECAACGHVQLDPRPTMATLGTIYPPHYYSYNMESEVSAIALRGKEILDGLKFSSILAALGRKPAAFVDVGCGDGRYLRLLERAHGVPRDKLYGLELSEKTVARLREAGYNAHCERAETCDSIPPGGVDLVTMFHVIEHVADPAAVTRRIAGWLAPGGIFALETPNLNALDARLFRRSFWGGYHIPRHWHLFHEKTLEVMLRAAGFEIVAMRYQTGHSFWMYSLHHGLRYRLGWRSLSRWFDPIKGLPFLIAFTGFDKLRAALGFRTSAVLVIARKMA